MRVLGVDSGQPSQGSASAAPNPAQQSPTSKDDDMTDITALSGTSIGQLKVLLTRRRVAELLLEAATGGGFVAKPTFIEVPPDTWSPEPSRADLDPDAVGELLDEAVLMNTDAASPEQLDRSLEFQLWQLAPELERVAALVFLLAKLPQTERGTA
jgi:hypothetical protein